MKIAGVICEFNPFHNGHQYMLQKVHEDGCSHVDVCMSGNFTQRGVPAVYDKYSRTAAALKNGADLVAELPVSFACAGAEKFAFGGVSVLDGLGCVDSLYFGSETGQTVKLLDIAEKLLSEEFSAALKQQLADGCTFAAARQKAVAALVGEENASLLSAPNDTLGVEYIKALLRLGSRMGPAAVLRRGAAHDDMRSLGQTASAKLIRELMQSGSQDYRCFIPENALREFDSSDAQPDFRGREKALESVMLYRLRSMSREEIALLPEISEGLENRIYAAVRTSGSIEELIDGVKTKRYTYARIRRILNYAMLGITAEDHEKQPAYIRILGFNEKGREILKEAGKKAKLPVIIRCADIRTEAEKDMFRQECYADDIYALSCQKPLPCGLTMTKPPVILRNY